MICAEPTKQLGGVVIWGDAWELDALYELVHRVASDTGPLAPITAQFLSGFAYDIRKAKEGERLKRQAKRWDDVKSIYGVEIVWVYLLLQLGILRAGAAFMTLRARDQANIWALEAAIQDALAASFGEDIGAALFEQAHAFRLGSSWDASLVKSNGRAAYYLKLEGRKKRRAALLPVMRTLDPLYDAMWSVMGAREGGPALINPNDFLSFEQNCDDILCAATL